MLFREKDVICFLGDSLTANGLYAAESYQTIRQKINVRCYNCGIAGGATVRAIRQVYDCCLHFNPDWVVMMFGINDIAKWIYSASHANVPDKESHRTKALEAHKEAYEKLVEASLAFGSKVILCVPVPYDEVSDRAEENLRCQVDMDEVGANVRAMAEKYGCPVVDFRKEFLPLLGKEEVIGPDRVHPTPLGYHLMAQVFLRDTGVTDGIDLFTPFVFEDWNRARFDAEQKLNRLNYVEFCDIFEISEKNHWTLAQKKEEAARRMERNQNNMAHAYREYIECADFRRHFESERIRLTPRPENV